MFIEIFYGFYLAFAHVIDKRDKKLQYSIITMQLEKERLETLLSEANRIIEDRERRSIEAQEELRVTIEENNQALNNVLAGSISASMSKESSSSKYFKFIS